MPFKANVTCNGTYESIYDKFVLSENGTLESNIADLKQIYMGKQLSRSVMEQAVGAGISHFKLSDYIRTPEEQKRCAERSAKVQQGIAEQLVKRLMFNRSMLEAHPELDMAGNRVFFLLRSDDEEFNQKIVDACKKDADPRKLTRLKYEEFKRLSEELGIQTAQDIANLYNLDDQKLADNFEKYSRFAKFVSELQTLTTSEALTPEERKYVTPFATLGIQLAGCLSSRIDLIANPYYAIFDTQRMYEKIPVSMEIDKKIEQMAERGVDFGGRQSTAADRSGADYPLGAYFGHINIYYRNAGASIAECLELLHPEMQGAVYSSEFPTAELTNGIPVVAHCKDGKDYVVTNTTNINDAPQTVLDYAKKLSKQAAKADRFLLTGSDQFTRMQKKLAEFTELQSREDVTKEEKRAMAGELKDLANQYFQRKQNQGKVDISRGFDMYTLLNKGKNQREQSRLEVAAGILLLATAEYDAMDAVIKKENAPVELTPEEKSAKQLEERSLALAELNKDFDARPSKFIDEKAPTKKVDLDIPVKGKDGKEITTKDVDIIPQSEFTLLCTLACTSPEATGHYERTLRVNGKVVMETVPEVKKIKDPSVPGGYREETTYKNVMAKEIVPLTNSNPDELHNNVLDLMEKGQKRVNLPYQSSQLVHSVTEQMAKCLKENDFATPGKLLADGIKMNNKAMQNEKGFTAKFDICANLNKKAMEMLKNHPELEQEVAKHLSQQDRKLMAAGQALHDLHREGIQAQQNLITRCKAGENGVGFDTAANENKMDVATVCHMYDTERKYFTGALTLDTLDPVKFAKDTQNLRDALVNTQTVNDFVNDLGGKNTVQRLNLVGSPHKMGDLFGKAAQKALTDQQNPFQKQMQMERVMQQPQQSAPAPDAPSINFSHR